MVNNYNSRADKWGTCGNGSECMAGSALANDEEEGNLSQFVGKPTVDALEYGCNCKGTQKYGPYCSWDEPDVGERDFCGLGKYNIENFVSGCECRDSATGAAVPYHGWYCGVHNKLLCDNSKFSKGFYDVNYMNTSNVADFPDPCMDCNKIIPNCAKCQQDDETNCELFG